MAVATDTLGPHESHTAPAAPSRPFDVLTGPVARALFAIPIALFGLGHFGAAEAMAPMVPAWVPGGGAFWVYVTGVALLAAAVAIGVGRYARPAALALALLLVTFAVTVHAPGLVDEATRQGSMVGLFKDVALAGGALAFARLATR